MKPRIAAALFALVAMTVWRVVLVGGLEDQGFSPRYLVAAERIASGELPRERIGDFSPLYVWLVTFLHGVLNLDAPTLRTIQIAVVSVVALLVAMTAFRFGGWIAAIAAGICVLGSRASLINASEIEPETLILLLHTLAMFFLLRTEPNNRLQRLAGVALGLSAATRPAGLLLAGLLIGWLWIREKRPPRAFASGLAIPIVPLLLINLILTGNVTIVDSGTAMYEGMNPHATGYAGVPPPIVKDLEATSKEPDALHRAYRFVASRAEGRNLSRAESNRYWSSKALAYVLHAPKHAARLIGRKLFFAIKSHDAHDRTTTATKDRELRRRTIWMPFALLLMLALAGLWTIRDAGVVVPLSLYALSVFITLAVFYVTTRQRDVMVPALAILAGIAISRLIGEIRGGQFAGAIGTLLLVSVFTVALHRDGHAQREDTYGWIALAEEQRLLDEASKNPSRADRLHAIATTWTTAPDADGSRALLRETALAGLQRTRSPQRRFDFGLALARAGDWNEAEKVLAGLQRENYRPMRGNRTTNSVAFHRSRALRRMGHRFESADELERAAKEQPGDAAILAALAIEGNSDAADALDRLHDPFTRDLALGRAALDRGNRAEAEKVARQLVKKMREWPRARKFATLIAPF